jgi:hypothetical protein
MSSQKKNILFLHTKTFKTEGPCQLRNGDK